ncbi:MAG: TonB-dependent receptor [Cytophagaceae bacterium]|jgi:outer membrane receptor for ferrienterochelin and colicin|nr:TonB-dependent receptor [Cytophagaceae bacterium]
MKNFLKVCVVVAMLAFGNGALAQELGMIHGEVFDTTEAIIDAKILVLGQPGIGAKSDIDGSFTIKRVTPGTVDIIISYSGYKTDTLRNIQVLAGKVTEVGRIQMLQNARLMKVVVVKGKRITNTEAAAVRETKESKQVVNVISSEQISKSQDRDAAQVMQRVPGITLIQNRFILVRGLSERYNSVLLNGVVAPSSESETRAFSFDIVPSNMIDRLLVYKSGSYDLPGDFAGAVIRLYTRNTVSENVSQLSITGGYRVGATLQKNLRQESGAADLFAFGDRRRALPGSIPDYDLKLIPANREAQINEISRAFQNNWEVKNKTALPDLRLNYLFGRKFNVGKVEVNSISNISYSNTNTYAAQRRNLYGGYDTLTNVSTDVYKFEDDIYSNDVRLGVLSNWQFKLSDRSRIAFRNLYSRLGSSETMHRTGTNFNSRQNISQYSLRYTSNELYSGQVQGSHESVSKLTKFSWLVGYSNTSRKDPDWKRATMLQPLDEPNKPFQVYISSTATATDGARFYMDMKESSVSAGLDVSRKFAKHADSSGITVSAGVYNDLKRRTYSARFLSYVTNAALPASVLNLPFDQIYDPANIAYPSSIFISEGSAPTDKYYGSNFLTAAYAGALIPFTKKLNLTAGMRFENNIQLLRITQDDSDLVNITKLSPLPFANLSYNFTEKFLARVAYGKTINRPEFRELSPFNYYDFTIPANKVGNPDLKNCDIHNLDLRAEFYPTPEEMISLGVFYKSFINPIEIYQLPTGSYTPVFKYGNASSAVSQGVELEIRKSLQSIKSIAWIKNFSVLFNASLIKSEIKFDNLSNQLQLSKRPMQGQSPYIVNVGLYYQNDEKKMQASILYNVFGPRIAVVGDKQSRTWYEMPRHLLDLTFSKGISERSTLRFGISDLLNSTYRIMEDADYDNKIKTENVDKVIQQFNTGQNFTFGWNYKF